MATLVEKLTAEGDGESAGFLNEIVAQLWPNIRVAGSQMIKDIVDPMFKTMLPGPLASLHFTKVELGPVPIVLSNVRVTKTAADGIKLDLNLDWEGQCDIQLDGSMIPTVVSLSEPATDSHQAHAHLGCQRRRSPRQALCSPVSLDQHHPADWSGSSVLY
jgi:hypothetical protein